MNIFFFLQGFSDVCTCFQCNWKRRKTNLLNNLREQITNFTFASRNEENTDSGRSNEIVGSGEFSNIIPELFSVKEKDVSKSLGVVAKKTFSIFKLKGKNAAIDDMNLSDLMASFSVVLEKLTSDAIKSLKKTDQIQVLLNTESGVMQRYVSTKLTSVENFDIAKLLILAEQYFQSNERSIKLSDGVRLEIVTVKMIKKSTMKHKGGSKYSFLSVLNAVKEKKSVVEIKNSDNLCMSKCIALALVKQNVLKGVTFSGIRAHDSTQTKYAMKLCDSANISYYSKCGIEEAKKFETALNISIKIFDAEAFLGVIYEGAPVNENTKASVFLLRSQQGKNGHFDLIVNMKAFLGKKFYCEFCNFAYNEIHQHHCSDVENWCFTCYDRTCKIETNFNEKCKICFRKFRNSKCMQRHLRPTKSNCKIFKCFDCNAVLRRREISPGEWETNYDMIIRHRDCEQKCSVCKEFVDENHACCMKRAPFKKHIEKVVYLDFETDFSSGRHIPIYCFMSWIFKTSENEERGSKEFGVSEENISDEVGSFLFSPKFKNSTVIAHNLKGFDGCFLLRYLVENNIKPRNIITDGTKITYLFVSRLNMRLIDSLNLIPLPLAQFGKAFGLEEAEKGMFPYKFVKPQNYNYIGAFPDKEEFGYDEMNGQKQKNFDEWYSKLSEDAVFNFQVELKKYCIQDVKILESGVEKFRELIKILSTPKMKEKQFDDEVTEYEITDDEEEVQNENVFPEIKGFSVQSSRKQKNFKKSIPKRKSLFTEADRKKYDERKKYPINCDPISYCTLASLCHALFKAHFIKDNSIALIPSGGYQNHKYSNKSIEWLEYLNVAHNKNIVHKLNSKSGDEVKIGRYRVDGYDAGSKTVYEFNGCFFHGHPVCISNMSSINPVSKVSFDILFRRTKQKEFALKKKGSM